MHSGLSPSCPGWVSGLPACHYLDFCNFGRNRTDGDCNAKPNRCCVALAHCHQFTPSQAYVNVYSRTYSCSRTVGLILAKRANYEPDNCPSCRPFRWPNSI